MINEIEDPTKIRSVAIIGSGLAGLSAAILLREYGYQITVFEKSRGPGGRLASKRVGSSSVDVGAQYFTVRNQAFREFLNHYAGRDTWQAWKGRFGYQRDTGVWVPFPDENRYVGVPRMTAVSRALSAHIELVTEIRIQSLRKAAGGWILQTTANESHGPYDAVIVTAPPAQARDLLRTSGLPRLASGLDEAVRHVQPCWALAAHFSAPPYKRFDGMKVHSDILGWVCNNSSKPGRKDDGQWWVLHAKAGWSQANRETPADTVAGEMVREFQALTGTEQLPDALVTHRWLYAKSSDTAAPGYQWYAQDRIGLAGDWLDGGRVEGAFNSANALVKAMTER